MRNLAACLILFSCFGCQAGGILTPAVQIEQTKTDANVIIAVAASIADNTEADKVWAVGKCDNCNGSGKTGDGFEDCNICDGDGQISKEDADRANNPAAAMIEEISDESAGVSFLSLKEAKEKSIKENLPVWIHFSKSKDCRICVLLKQNVFPEHIVGEAAEKFAVAQVDCGDGSDPKIAKLLADFRVDRREGLPQDLFLLPGWKQIAKPMVSRCPITAQGYVDYLNKWAEYLTTR